MENTDQIVADEAETEARGAGKKAPSPAREGERTGKIGPNGGKGTDFLESPMGENEKLGRLS